MEHSLLSFCKSIPSLAQTSVSRPTSQQKNELMRFLSRIKALRSPDYDDHE